MAATNRHKLSKPASIMWTSHHHLGRILNREWRAGYGWGNRLLDLSACLLTALTTDRVLLVNWSNPQSLAELASPSTFDWGGHADIAAFPLHPGGGASDPFGPDKAVHVAHNLRSLPSRVYSRCAAEGGDAAAVLSIVGDYTGPVIGTLLSA